MSADSDEEAVEQERQVEASPDVTAVGDEDEDLEEEEEDEEEDRESDEIEEREDDVVSKG